jgi:tRNA nucleotidyltransferase (CCA-adding enzyme)
VFLVGGSIRDILLGVPTSDLDFVLEGDAPQLASMLARELGWQLVVYDRFGTATVSQVDCHIDLVSARQEAYPVPGALPQVSPGTIHDDLARRDFSINTLALPLYQPVPRTLDEHHGIDELGKGWIRALHPVSFADDPTRTLRAVRYEQRFGFVLEAASEGQLREALARGCMDAVSGDRLRHELELILKEECPGRALARAIDLGVLKAIHPALTDKSALLSLDSRSNHGHTADPMEYLAALAFPLSSRDAAGVIQRLNLPAPWARVVQDTVATKELDTQLSAPNLPDSEVCRLLDGLSSEAMAAVALVRGPDLVAQRIDHYLTSLRQVRPLLDGSSVLAMGVPEGPLVGRILEKLRAAKLDHLVESAEDERQMVRRILAGREDA